MIYCPACGFENIEGSDSCDKCGTSLTSVPEEWMNSMSIERSISDPISKAGMRKAVVVSPNTPVIHAIAQMKELHRGCALVVQDNQLVGILTTRDVLHRLAKPNLSLRDIAVETVMSRSPEVLNETDTVGFALNKMAMGNYRHVPIQLRDGNFGVFSCRDALDYFF